MLLMLSLAAGLAAQPAAPPFTLADAIARAREASPVRDAAVRLAAGAGEAARLAGRMLNSQFDFRIENLWPDGPGLSKDVFAVINQPIELGGKRRIRRDLGAADAAVATAHVATTDWALTARVTAAYLDALRARRRVEILEASRLDLATAVEVMARRLEEGLVAEADVLKVRADLARVDL
ncbi:MAG: TolC family protein, partial [Vicinamibacterales bacterium]